MIVKLRARDEYQRHHPRCPGRNHPIDHIIRLVRLPRIPRQRLAKVPLLIGPHDSDAQQPIHGLLPSIHPRTRRPTPRPTNTTGRRRHLRMEMHGSGPQHHAPRLKLRPRPSPPPLPRHGRLRPPSPRGRNRSLKLNTIQQGHRRDALWQSEAARRATGPLLLPSAPESSPLTAMTREERVQSDFRGTGLTVGRHPLALRRDQLNQMRVITAANLHNIKNGRWVRTAGCVICRQRPGTAKGFVFLSLEDETGVSNAIVPPDTFEKYKTVLVKAPYLLIEGVLQNQQGVVSIRAHHVTPLTFNAPFRCNEPRSLPA